MSYIKRGYTHNYTSRGRLSSERSKTGNKAIGYLARMAISKNIDSSKFFNSLVEAWVNNESACENLVIRCRKKTRESAVFIFTIERKALAQLTVPEQVLKEKNPIKEYIDALPPEAVSAKKPVTKNLKIKDLELGMKHVNIKACLLETPKPKLVLTRWGAEAYISNVLIADETVTIRLSLWNDQINKVSGDNVIKIENANVVSFGGKRQLKLGKIGKVNVIEGEDFPPFRHIRHSNVC